jgi:hypothetical protein
VDVVREPFVVAAAPDDEPEDHPDGDPDSGPEDAPDEPHSMCENGQKPQACSSTCAVTERSEVYSWRC